MDIQGPPQTSRQARRAARLRQLVESTDGGAAQIQRDTGTAASHISAILHGRRGVGDALAEKLEIAYGKPAGWFDESNGDWPFAPELRAAVERLAPAERARVERVLRTLLEIAGSDASAGSIPAQSMQGNRVNLGPSLDAAVIVESQAQHLNNKNGRRSVSAARRGARGSRGS